MDKFTIEKFDIAVAKTLVEMLEHTDDEEESEAVVKFIILLGAKIRKHLREE